ncbi:hypothetical protein Bca4012_100995 [Brassica carinata]
MVKVLTYFGMTLAAFAFWQSMDKVHVWIALHQDEKVLFLSSCEILKFDIELFATSDLGLGSNLSKKEWRRKRRSSGLEQSCCGKLERRILLPDHVVFGFLSIPYSPPSHFIGPLIEFA